MTAESSSDDAGTTPDATATDATATSTDDRPVLELVDLEAGYETGQVLFGVDLAVGEGELVSLLGRNGAGKTTTLRAIMGGRVPRVTGGDVRYLGDSLLGVPSYRRANRGLAIVPEKRRCFPRLTVVENIEVAVNAAADPLTVDTVLEFFPELADMRTKHARNMSGGEQQMLAIARALAAGPDLMVLDEPFEGLAPYIVRRIEDIIAEINDERGVTVFFVEQNAAAALAIASRHYILDEGRIVAAVTTDRLRDDDELRRTYLGV